MASRGKIAIIGAGAVGCALGRLLRKKGFTIVGVASRSLTSARRGAAFIGGRTKPFADPVIAASLASQVFITTPDRAIADVVKDLARRGGLKHKPLVLHTSGFFSSRILQPAKRKGCAVASLHPLQSFANASSAMRVIPGSYFGWEGSQGVRTRIIRLIRALEGEPLEIRAASKPLYHAAAVMVSNYTATLFAEGAELLEKSRRRRGPRSKKGLPLLPLLLGTCANLSELGMPRALTGPLVRGDLGVVRGHLRAFRRGGRDFLPLYLLLGRRTLPMAKIKGKLKPAQVREFRRLLKK